MKGLKYIVCPLLTAAVSASCISTGFASGNLNAVFDADTKRVEVTGIAGAKERVTLKVMSKSDYDDGDISNVTADKIAYFNHADTDTDGNFTFTFQIASGRTNGHYVVIANSDGLNEETCEFILIDNALIADELALLNQAEESDIDTLIGDGIFTVFGTESSEVEYYINLNSVYRGVVNASWVAARPEGGYTSKEQANSGFYSACSYAALKSIEPTDENKSEIETRIKNIFDGLGSSQIWEKYMGTNSGNTLGTAVKEKTYADALSALQNSNTAVAFADAVTNDMILNTINLSTSWMGYKEIIDSNSANGGFSDYIDGIDRTSLNKVSEAEVLKEAYNSRKSSYTSISEFVQDINAASAKIAASGSGSSGSTGSSSGSSGSSGSSLPNYSVTSTPSPSVPDNSNTDSDDRIFTDLDNFQWAAEAINELAAKNIINGVGDRLFDPGARVTREQFLKMLVVAFNIPTDEGNTTDFTDCSDSDWSYPYIAAAQSRGLVNGSDGRFGKTDYIKREDAAVMTYRFMGGNISGSKAVSFADSSEIADYAAEAVLAMAKAGILNGDDTGRFAPKNNMIRAEAAQIIYNSLQKAKEVQ